MLSWSPVYIGALTEGGVRFNHSRFLASVRGVIIST